MELEQAAKQTEEEIEQVTEGGPSGPVGKVSKHKRRHFGRRAIERRQYSPTVLNQLPAKLRKAQLRKIEDGAPTPKPADGFDVPVPLVSVTHHFKDGTEVTRNSLCPCGSGFKVKRCVPRRHMMVKNPVVDAPGGDFVDMPGADNADA